MAWEYMEELDYRYEDAIKYIEPYLEDGDFVVDLCSGNSRFGNFLTSGIRYYSCDLYDSRAKYVMGDDKFVREIVTRCDVLTLFGYGGYEIDQHPLESNTVLDSMKYIIETHNPKIIITESITKYHETLLNMMKEYKNYIKHDSVHTENDDWLNDRVLTVWKKI